MNILQSVNWDMSEGLHVLEGEHMTEPCITYVQSPLKTFKLAFRTWLLKTLVSLNHCLIQLLVKVSIQWFKNQWSV